MFAYFPSNDKFDVKLCTKFSTTCKISIILSINYDSKYQYWFLLKSRRTLGKLTFNQTQTKFRIKNNKGKIKEKKEEKIPSSSEDCKTEK
jgi:hypothetical protein